MTSLSVSIVSHFSDRQTLADTLTSLARAVDHARIAGALDGVEVSLIDNSLDPIETESLRVFVATKAAEQPGLKLIITSENRGYGAANNIAVRASHGDFHLVLNPDVELETDCVLRCIESMQARPSVVLITPHVSGDTASAQHVAKSMPGVLTLLARALPGVPGWLRDNLGNERYELRRELRDVAVTGRFLAGGCFMFCRTEALKAAGGFDEAYFMYFEDFDLSMRLARQGEVLFEPAARIRHGGGHASRKGLRHIAWFARSALRFMRLHGWRWMS